MWKLIFTLIVVVSGALAGKGGSNSYTKSFQRGVPPSQKECKHFFHGKNGCLYGDKCMFSHIRLPQHSANPGGLRLVTSDPATRQSSVYGYIGNSQQLVIGGATVYDDFVNEVGRSYIAKRKQQVVMVDFYALSPGPNFDKDQFIVELYQSYQDKREDVARDSCLFVTAIFEEHQHEMLSMLKGINDENLRSSIAVLLLQKNQKDVDDFYVGHALRYDLGSRKGGLGLKIYHRIVAKKERIIKGETVWKPDQYLDWHINDGRKIREYWAREFPERGIFTPRLGMSSFAKAQPVEEAHDGLSGSPRGPADLFDDPPPFLELEDSFSQTVVRKSSASRILSVAANTRKDSEPVVKYFTNARKKKFFFTKKRPGIAKGRIGLRDTKIRKPAIRNRYKITMARSQKAAFSKSQQQRDQGSLSARFSKFYKGRRQVSRRGGHVVVNVRDL